MNCIIADDSRGSNAWAFIRKGWARAFDLSGHNVYFWDIHSQPAIDLFDDFKPDLVMAQSYNLERGLMKCLLENPQVKVVLQAGDWSEWSNAIDGEKYPILKASDKEIKNVETLLKHRNIDLITAHYHDRDILKTHRFWFEKLDIKIAGLPPALDVVDYVGGVKMDEFECDIIHISGYWGYKSQVINEYFLPLLSESNLKIKLFGNRPWPGPAYMGTLDTKYVKHAFKSAKLNINIGEPHALLEDGVEVNEKVFKLLGGKNQVLSTAEGSLMRNFFNSGEIEYGKTPKEFQEKARAIVAGDLTVDTTKGYDVVMSKHTYFHRVSSLFSYLGLEQESEHVMSRFSELRRVNNI